MKTFMCFSLLLPVILGIISRKSLPNWMSRRFFFFFNIYMLFICCSGFQLQHVGSSSLTRDWTWALSIGSTVLATGPPGMSHMIFALWFFFFEFCICVVQVHCCVRLFVTPWTVAHQAPLSMGFPRQEYWSGLPCPPPGDLPNPGIRPVCPALQADSLLIGHWGSLHQPLHLYTTPSYIDLTLFWLQEQISP